MAEDNKQDIKNQQETEATKNAAVNAAKMYGGPVGLGVNLASKTKLGNAVLNKGAEQLNKQNPGLGKLTSALNKGNGDLLNKNNQNNNTDTNGNKSGSSEKTGGSKIPGLGGSNKSSNLDSTDEEAPKFGGEFSNAALEFIKKHWTKVAAIAGGALLLLIVFITVYVVIVSVAGGVGEFFGKIGDALIGFFAEDEQKSIKKYYDELEKVKADRYRRLGVCIDENLITATLTVDVDAQDYANSVDEDKPPIDDNPEVAADSSVDYKKMTKEVGLLANMQIKNIKYGNNKDVVDGSIDCRSKDEGGLDELVSEENLELLYFPSWWENFLKALQSDETKEEKYISTNPDLVSRHDLTGWSKFFAKKVNEEKNFEYHIYTPAYEEECTTGSNGVRTCSEVCDRTGVPSKYEIPALSIGDLDTMEESVYYWNLVNSFIPEYYSEYIPEEEGEERDAAIKKIAEDIYLLYADIGPGKECTSSYYSPIAYSNACPDGIMVKDPKTNNIINVDLEDYVAGVIAAENNWHQGDNIEAMKAQAVAARTYALAATNSCQNPIENSSGKQNYKPTNDPYAIKAAYDTAGMVLYKDGNIMSTEYDAFCVSSYDKASSNYTIKQKNQVIPKSFVDSDGSFCKGTSKPESCGCNGHGRGMSQIGARYLQTQGLDFMAILDYYYGDGTNKLNVVSTGGLTGDWANWKQKYAIGGGLSPWADVKIGNAKLGDVGCLVTSLAILIARSGAPVQISDFNPGTFAQYLNSQGSFSKGGSLNNFDHVPDVVPSFSVVAYGAPYTLYGIQESLNRGYYVQIKLQKGDSTHFVAVDRVVGDTIYINDPGYTKRFTIDDYNGIKSPVSINVYKIG